jgi:hypothetical protein
MSKPSVVDWGRVRPDLVAGEHPANRELALDALNVDGPGVAAHRRQQVWGAGWAIHLVAQVDLVLGGQTLHARREVGRAPEIIQPAHLT